MNEALTPEQSELVDKAASVARKCLEPRASGYDESASHPWESWHDLWEHGFLGAAVPQEYGGLGLDMLTYISVVEKLAAGCTNSTMTLHMHSVVQMFIDALMTEEQKAALYPDVIDEGRLFGSWGSEPDDRGGSVVRGTVLSRRDGEDAGYVVSGRKHFCTMAGAAFRYMVHCNVDGYDGPQGYQLVLIPKDTPGIQVTGGWNTLGMRATVSPGVSFEECLVSQDALLGRPGEALTVGVMEAFGLGYAAIYIGAAQRALDFTVDYLKTQRRGSETETLAYGSAVQNYVAEMTMALEGARQVLYQSAARWAGADPQGRAVLAARANLPATQAALMVTSRCLETVGGRSAHRHFPLERLFRDVRTSTLMPPNVQRSIEIIGRTELGVADDVLDARYS